MTDIGTKIPGIGSNDTTTTTSDQRFYGKYRGTVTNNADPQKMGRIQATVPDISGASLQWAMPCVPVVKDKMSLYGIPPIGAGVWIEFEQGKPDYPIWSGCYWTSAIAPSRDASSVVLCTENGNELVISDQPGAQGGIVIKSTSGASIVVNDAGITIDNGLGASITLTGQIVGINKDGLTVT